MKDKLINMSIILVASLVLYFMWSLFFISMGYSQTFNYGKDTYSKWANILIINSLGDKVEESKFIHNGIDLGYNDFIPENAFKNDLYNQGYTKVYDFNDTSLDLVEVGYMGRLGNPRSYDADYVLRSEYEKYSSQYQNIRIDDNKNNIIAVDKRHTIWNEEQDIRLDDIDIHSAYQDMRLDANKNNILLNRQQININADNIQNNTDEIERVDNDSIKRDKKLNKKIKKVDNKHTVWNEEQDERLDDVELYNDYQDVKINDNKNNIINVDNKHTDWNTKQDVSINNNSNRINTLNDKVDNIDSRVSNLEDTQTIIGTEIRLYDSKKWTVSAFADYSTNRQMIDRTGVKFLYKIGRSYEEKRLDELERKLNLLTQEEIQDDIIITPTENGFRVTSKF